MSPNTLLTGVPGTVNYLKSSSLRLPLGKTENCKKRRPILCPQKTQKGTLGHIKTLYSRAIFSGTSLQGGD